MKDNLPWSWNRFEVELVFETIRIFLLNKKKLFCTRENDFRENEERKKISFQFGLGRVDISREYYCKLVIDVNTCLSE